MHKFSSKSIVGVLGVLLYAATIVLIVKFESQSSESNIKDLYDGFWYAIVTLTTVGYGDFYPVTPIGRILSLFLIIGSLGLLGILISSITSLFFNYFQKQKQGYYGTKMENHFIIIGWDNFSKQVADEIIHTGSKICVITNNQNDLELVKNLYTEKQVFSMFCDYDNYEALKKINIEKSKSVFVNLGEDSKSLVYIINLQKHYKLNIVVSLETVDLKETFKTVGVNHIVAKNQISSKLVASYIFEPDVAIMTEDLITTSKGANEYDIVEYQVLGNSEFVDSNYFDSFVKLKKRYDSILIGVSRQSNGKFTLHKNPDSNFTIELGDYLIVISSNKQKKRLGELFSVKEGR